MDSAVPQVASSAPVIFEDGFGQRRVTSSAEGTDLEILALRPQLCAGQAFEFALRDRVSRLAGFQSERFARVRSVEKAGKAGGLALVSEHVPGVRLAELLSMAEDQLLPIETDAALCLIRQLVHGVAALHDKAQDLCHGTIGPERIVITPQARLVLVEHVLGSAVEQLRYSDKQYWRDLRVPLPRTIGAPHFDRRSDVAQVGVTALALLLGRPLGEEEHPDKLGDLTASAWSLSATGGMEPLPLALRVWLQRALQIDSRTPFGSALEARAELDRVLQYSDPIAELEALKAFLSRQHDAARAVASRSAPPEMLGESRSVLEPSVVLSTSARAEARSTEASIASDATSPALGQAPTEPPAPVVGSSVSVVDGTPASPADAAVPVEDGAPAPARQPVSRLRLAAAAMLLVAITSGATLAGRRLLSPPVTVDGMGRLVVETTPPGALVTIDGEERGLSPISLDLAPGRYTLRLVAEGNVRSMPITVVAGGQVSQFVELPRLSEVLGQLHVRTEPEGARVTVDGNQFGSSPVTVEGLAPGIHTVLVENEIGSVTQRVRIEAGADASLVVPLIVPRDAPLSGWIAVATPEEVQVFEGDRLLGSSKSERIMVAAGHHDLRIVSETFAYDDTRPVEVAAGKVATVAVDWPVGSLALNAVPWAEVWIDGERVGETPLGNVSVPVGTHDVVFRHPELGEQSVRAVVTSAEPTKVSVDLRAP